MTLPHDQSPLANFSGRAPLFPLPEIAFFPHSLLPLHIFEPRYRQMTADALAGDRCIAMAQLKPGWEKTPPDAAPPIFEVVCLGTIVAAETRADGRYDLILQGMARARIVSETAEELPYRVARLEIRPDRISSLPTIDRSNRRRELLESFRDLYPRLELDKSFYEAAGATLSLGVVCDILAASLSLSPEQAQEVLAEEDVDVRSDLVLARLRELRRKAQGPRQPRTFPPGFSAN